MTPERESGQVWEIQDGRRYLILEEVPDTPDDPESKYRPRAWRVFDSEDHALYVWSEHQMAGDVLVCASPERSG